MARTIRNAELSTRSARLRLPAEVVHWMTLDREVALAYRRGRRGGVWTVRVYVNGSYRQEQLGIADDTLDADGDVILDFSSAQKKARERSVEIRREEQGLIPKGSGPYRVADALKDYVEAWARGDTKHDPGAEPRDPKRFNGIVRQIAAEIGDIEVARLTSERLTALRDKLADTPSPRSVPRWTPEQRLRKRKATANRNMGFLFAALNRAFEKKRVHSNEAWKRVKFFRNVGKQKDEYELAGVQPMFTCASR